MAKGIKFPVVINPRGGAETLEGPELTRQNIKLGVIPASNRHPWNQRLTPRETLIFDIADNLIGGELESYIYDLFDDLERLNLATISRRSNGVVLDVSTRETGDVEVIINYTDLEDSKSREIRFKGK